MRIKSIGNLIDSSIPDFMSYLNDLNFSECNGMKKLLEGEHHRILLAREQLKLVLANGHDKVQEYVTSFVVEQKISDRYDIIMAVLPTKGVDLSIFSK